VHEPDSSAVLDIAADAEPAQPAPRQAPTFADLVEIVWWAVMALMVLCGLTSLWWPISADAGVLSYVGDVILSGGRQYCEVWDNNGPAGPLQQAALQAVFGSAQWPLRVLDLGYVLTTVLVLYAVGRRLHSRAAGMWSAGLYVTHYIPVERGELLWCNAAQRDGWASMLALWSMALAFSRGGMASAGACGLLMGVAALYKPFFAALALPLAWLLFARCPDDWPRSKRLVQQVCMWAAMALPPLMVIAWMKSQGNLRGALDEFLMFNAKVYAHSMGLTVERGFRWFLEDLTLGHAAVFVLGIAGAAKLLTGNEKGKGALALGYPIVAAGIVFGQVKLFPYHWHTLHVPLALLGGVGLAAWGTQAAAMPRADRAVQLALLSAVLFTALFNPVHANARAVKLWVVDVALRGNLGEYQKALGGSGGYGIVGYHGHKRIAEYIRSHTRPTERVQVWGADMVVYFLSERLCATRFAANWPFDLTRELAPALNRKYLGQFLGDLDAAKPALFMVVTQKPEGTDPPWSDNVGQPMPPELLKYLNEHYVVAEANDVFTALRLKNAPRPQPEPFLPDIGTGR
jgi:hypothetical protein